jgi:alpha-L-rhamnosidase
MASPWTLSVNDLTVEHRVNPLGIDIPQPRFSWNVTGPGRNRRQTAYCIQAWTDGLDGREPLWDTGTVEGSACRLIPYEGPPLVSRQRVVWRVQVRDEAGRWSDPSDPAWFEMGLMDDGDWAAVWIAAPPGDPAAVPDAPPAAQVLTPPAYFRKAFAVAHAPRRARLYVTAQGVYMPYVNGVRVGDRRLAPGWSEYRRRMRYQVYDITDALRAGLNEVGIVVADGWYAGYLGYTGQRQHYGERPALLVQVELDGRPAAVSDASWAATRGPILYADLLMGEAYDARRAVREASLDSGDGLGWDPGGDWVPVDVVSPPTARLSADRTEGVAVTEVLEPRRWWKADDHTWLFDMGRNVVGVTRLQVAGPSGCRIRVRYGEALDADGRLYVDNLRGAAATDLYILRGEGCETFQPRFTFHGFRYVEVQGLPDSPTAATVAALVMESVTRPTGDLMTGHDLVNRLVANILTSQRGNFLAVPTDCPQRDERLGWMGDAQVFCRTAAYNRDVAAFFTEWLETVRDSQSPEGAFPDVAPRLIDDNDGAPGWGDAGVIIPWTLYEMYGDRGLLSENYGAMRNWFTYIAEANPNGLWLARRGLDFGDWLAVGEETPKDLVATAYFGWDAKILAQAAHVLGREQDAAEYEAWHAKIGEAFWRAFGSEDGRVAGDTQTGYLLALAAEVAPKAQRPALVRHLVANWRRHGQRLTTGFAGVALLAPILVRYGRVDEAYRLLVETGYPSWLYPVRHGATSIWERWDGWTEEKGFQNPEMNSFNHYALGSVGEFLFREVAGIEPAAPGFAALRLKPHPHPALGWVRARFESGYGPVTSCWQMVADGYRLTVTVPANVSAEVWLVAGPGYQVSESGRKWAGPVRQERDEAGTVWTVLPVGSGRYRFRVAAEQA